MKVLTASLPPKALAVPREWFPEDVRVLAHEFGVMVDPACNDPTWAGEQAQAIVNGWRASGNGPVIPLAQLHRRIAGRWYSAYRAREQRAVRSRVDARICDLLNAEDSGLIVVAL